MMLFLWLMSMWEVATPTVIHECTEASIIEAMYQGATELTFACSGTITLRNLITVRHTLTFDGGEGTVVLTGDLTPMFRVLNTGTLTLKHLKLQALHESDIETSGTLNLTDCTFVSDNRVPVGRALDVTYGTVNIDQSSFHEKSTAIYLRPGSKAVITGTTFESNEHAIYNMRGSLSVEASTFTDNLGAGIYTNSSTTVKGSTFTGNNHGIDNDGGVVTVVNSTFMGNHTNTPGGIGAAIANRNRVTIINSTFADNTAPLGGAIGSHYGGSVSLQNSIVTGSGSNCYGPVTDAGHNLQYPDTSCGETIPRTDPQLLPLADNGGSTFTMALQPGSPAIADGNSATCLADPVANVDQRGQTRIQTASTDETSCDIGAYEHQAGPN
jgi:hypothetical protein